MHYFGHLDADRVVGGRECRGEDDKPRLARLARSVSRVERGVYLAQDFDVTFDLLKRVADQGDAAVYEAREGAQRLFAAPFFPAAAAVALSRESRISPSAAAMRNPGGKRGPPWSSLRTPRTVAQ